MADYLSRHARADVPQTERLNKRQHRNPAGGFVYDVGVLGRLRRWLILGSEGGTYYVGQRQLTEANIENIDAALREDPEATIEMIREISVGGLAPKQDQVLYALAVALSFDMKGGDQASEIRAEAAKIVPEVCRIPTHWFQLANYIDVIGRRGWGPALHRVFEKFYVDSDIDDLAFWAIKYPGRHTWTHADMLRKTKPAVPRDSARGQVFRFMLDPKHPTSDLTPEFIWGYRAIRETMDAAEAAKLIRKYRLPWEAVPDHFLNAMPVLEVFAETMPYIALARQLPRFSRAGLTPNSDLETAIVRRLEDEDLIRKSRIHPLQALVAEVTYGSGGAQGRSRGASYIPSQRIQRALGDAVMPAFKNIEPTGKRFYIALDVSGSMGWGNIAGMPGIMPRVGAAVMALATVKAEEICYVRGFSHKLVEIPLRRSDDIRTAVQMTEGIPFGGTDCALPMLDAKAQRIPVDAFVVYTDNESWAGGVHPSVALEQYRDEMGIDAKLIVVGMTASRSLIGDPEDAGTLSLVGFDASAPATISDFAAGKI